MTKLPTQLEEAAAWASAFDLASAPSDVVHLATLQIANLLAAMFAGSRTEAGHKVWLAHQGTLSSGPCTVVPHGDRVSLRDALYLNAVYANALELDDYQYGGHLSPATVVVPLALAEVHHCDGRAMLRAQIVGNELASRLGCAITAEIRHGHQRSYLLRFAAAAAAGSMLGLDEHRLASAFAIALTQPEVPLHRGEFSPDTKILSAATSVVEGVRAAYLAREDFGAALDILEHPAGFYRQLTRHRDAPSPFVQLGDVWSTHSLSFKRYAACAYAAGAVDAACHLRRDPSFDRDAIRKVSVETSLPALILERLAAPHEPGELTAVNVQFSIVRSTAAALWLGDLRGHHYERTVAHEVYDAVRRLQDRVTLSHDWIYTIHVLRGVDAGLREKGTRRSADMLQYYRTSSELRRMFGSVRAIGPADLVRIWRLPADDRQFFVRRWQRSLASYLVPQRAVVGPITPFGDLRLHSFRMAARVTVTMNNGRTVSAERIVPTGFAGDPNREAVVREKLNAESVGILDPHDCEQLWQAIRSLADDVDPGRLASLACVNSLAAR